MDESKTVTAKEVREALLKMSWDVNRNLKGKEPVLVVYPNELLCELFGEELMKKYWISDAKAE